MIIEFLMNAFAFLIKSVFSLLPDFPRLSDDILATLDVFSNILADSIGFVQYIYGYGFFTAIIAFFTSILAFKIAYYVILWIIKKIPGGMD